MSRAFRVDLRRLVGITHSLTTPFHPQANGKLERYRQTINRDVNQIPHEVPSYLKAAFADFEGTYIDGRYHVVDNVTLADVLDGRRSRSYVGGRRRDSRQTNDCGATNNNLHGP